MVFINPENRPDGHFGDALDRVAGAYRHALQPFVDASDAEVLAGAERGELVDPDPEVAAQVAEAEEAVNYVGSMFVGVQNFINAVLDMTPEERAEAFPDYDFTNINRYTRQTQPGRVGRRVRPVLRFLGLEPPWWAPEESKE